MSCGNCFKNVTNPNECLFCRYNQAVGTLSSLEHFMSPKEIEEVRYEMFQKIENQDRREKEPMSDLMTFVGKCGETAINLAKKRFVLEDELQCIMFNPNGEDAYITNGDVACHIAAIPEEVVSRVNLETPVFDYIAGRFLPNSLPYERADLAKLFGDTYVWSYAINVPLTLDKILAHSPTPLDRRSHLAVIDLGYSVQDRSIIIPQFELINGHLVYQPSPNVKPCFVAKDSIIGEDLIRPNTAYACYPEQVNADHIVINVYKVYDDTVNIGLYKLLPIPMEEDLNPLALSSYSAKDLYSQKLFCPSEKFTSPVEKMNAFKDCPPIIIELEYLYNLLRLFLNFQYGFISMYVKGPNLPVMLEGIRPTTMYPAIECLVNTINLGMAGGICEDLLAQQLSKGAYTTV